MRSVRDVVLVAGVACHMIDWSDIIIRLTAAIVIGGVIGAMVMSLLVLLVYARNSVDQPTKGALPMHLTR